MGAQNGKDLLVKGGYDRAMASSKPSRALRANAH